MSTLFQKNFKYISLLLSKEIVCIVQLCRLRGQKENKIKTVKKISIIFMINYSFVTAFNFYVFFFILDF